MVAAQAKALQRNRILAIARAVHLGSGGYGTAIAALSDTTPCSAQKAYHRFASHSLILIVKVPPQLRSPPVGSDNSSGQKRKEGKKRGQKGRVITNVNT